MKGFLEARADLSSLSRLVGAWAVSGDVEGTITYEWTRGRFFLLRHDSLSGIEGLSVIGLQHRYGNEDSTDITSRYYGFSEGETLDYVYDMTGDTLTVWLGERGARAYYQGTFSYDSNILVGAWHYPGGGGYALVATRSD